MTYFFSLTSSLKGSSMHDSSESIQAGRKHNSYWIHRTSSWVISIFSYEGKEAFWGDFFMKLLSHSASKGPLTVVEFLSQFGGKNISFFFRGKHIFTPLKFVICSYDAINASLFLQHAFRRCKNCFNWRVFTSPKRRLRWQSCRVVFLFLKKTFWLLVGETLRSRFSIGGEWKYLYHLFILKNYKM